MGTECNDHNLIRQFVTEQIFQIQHRLNVCHTQCRSQTITCPSTLTLNSIDEPLKQFVLVYQKRLFHRMTTETKQLQAQIHENTLLNPLISSAHLVSYKVIESK